MCGVLGRCLCGDEELCDRLCCAALEATMAEEDEDDAAR